MRCLAAASSGEKLLSPVNGLIDKICMPCGSGSNSGAVMPGHHFTLIVFFARYNVLVKALGLRTDSLT